MVVTIGPGTAARVRVLPPEEILHRLDTLHQLEAGNNDIAEIAAVTEVLQSGMLAGGKRVAGRSNLIRQVGTPALRFVSEAADRGRNCRYL